MFLFWLAAVFLVGQIIIIIITIVIIIIIMTMMMMIIYTHKYIYKKVDRSLILYAQSTTIPRSDHGNTECQRSRTGYLPD